jgi:hypothetical protein
MSMLNKWINDTDKKGAPISQLSSCRQALSEAKRLFGTRRFPITTCELSAASSWAVFANCTAITRAVRIYQPKSRPTQTHRDITVHANMHAGQLKSTTGMGAFRKLQEAAWRNHIRTASIERALSKNSEHFLHLFAGRRFYGPARLVSWSKLERWAPAGP